MQECRNECCHIGDAADVREHAGHFERMIDVRRRIIAFATLVPMPLSGEGRSPQKKCQVACHGVCHNAPLSEGPRVCAAYRAVYDFGRSVDFSSWISHSRNWSSTSSAVHTCLTLSACRLTSTHVRLMTLGRFCGSWE